MSFKGLDVPVRDLMRPGVVTIGERASLEQARRALLSHGVHAVLVVGAGGVSRGWVMARGVLARAGDDPALVTAGQVVCEPVVRISPMATGAEAARMLVEHRVSRLIVARTDAEPPEGVIGELDLLAATGEPRYP